MKQKILILILGALLLAPSYAVASVYYSGDSNHGNSEVIQDFNNDESGSDSSSGWTPGSGSTGGQSNPSSGDTGSGGGNLSPTPIPAAGIVFLGGLGVLGLLRRRVNRN